MVSCRRRFSSKLALAAILCLCAVTGLLAQSARKLTLASEVEAYFQDWGGSFLPRWSGHALLGPVLGDGSHVWVITKDGQREDVRFTFPGAGWITIVGASRRPDGALALIGAAASSDSQMGRFVAWISPDRTRQAVVRVTPYSPKTVTFAPDGTFWTAGEMSATEYDVLWHFDDSGRKLGSSVRRSTVRGGMPAAGSHLNASRDRIGWYTGWGSAGTGEYIEVAPNGEMIDRFPGVPLPPHAGWRPRAAALSENNDVIVDMKNSGNGAEWIYALDRVNRSWVPLQLPDGQSYPVVAGFEGNNLVFRAASKRIRFYKLPGPATR